MPVTFLLDRSIQIFQSLLIEYCNQIYDYLFFCNLEVCIQNNCSFFLSFPQTKHRTDQIRCLRILSMNLRVVVVITFSKSNSDLTPIAQQSRICRFRFLFSSWRSNNESSIVSQNTKIFSLVISINEQLSYFESFDFLQLLSPPLSLSLFCI